MLAGIVAQPWLAKHNFPTARWLANSLGVQNGRLLLWLAALLLLLGFMAVTGHGTTGRWVGVLIDGRNRLSLSRLQMVTWTIVVLSAYYTAVLWRLTGELTPTDLAIPQELWLAIGISVTSLVGTPLILSTKTGRVANSSQALQTFDLLVTEGAKAAAQGQVVTDPRDPSKIAVTRDGKVTVGHRGQLVVKASPQEADWPDLFMGEETGNAAQLDLAKVQQFYFTLIVVITYGSSLSMMFTGTTLPGTLPALAQSLVALLGLSHAGYLVNKVFPHSQGGAAG